MGTLFPQKPINTLYLIGEEYIYIGNEMDNLDIYERDNMAKSLITQRGGILRSNTYSSPKWSDGGVKHIGYSLVTCDYKPAAFK
jgi:hypothetical protein